MSIAMRSLFMTALLAFMCVLSGTLLIPAVRPFTAWTAAGNERAAQAFMALGMLPAIMLSVGLSSAAVLAAATREAVKGTSEAPRIAAISGLSAAGGLGMRLGTTSAGIASALLGSYGHSARGAHSFSFILGGSAQLLVATLTLARATLSSRVPRSIRS